MKLNRPIAAIFAATVLAVTGCSFVGGILTKPVVTQIPVQVPGRTNAVVVTNTTPEVVATNVIDGQPVVVTHPAVVTVATNLLISPPSTVYVTTTNYVANDQFLGGIETAKSLNAGFNPTPTAPIVNWALTLVAGAAGVVAAWKNKQAGALSDMVDAVVHGVESAPPGVGIDGVKRSIAAAAAAIGVGDSLHERVQTVSASLKDILADGTVTAAELLALANNPAIPLSDIPSNLRDAVAKIRA